MSHSGFLEKLIDIIGGIIGILLTLRILLIFFNASTNAPFVRWIYETTSPLVSPFSGIFPRSQLNGGFILDFSSIIALVAYAFLFYILAEIVSILTYHAANRLHHEHK